MIYKILCRFCGTQTGQIEFPGVPDGAMIPPEQHGILDARCDVHEIEHGKYKEMWEVFDRDVDPRDETGGNEMFKQIMADAEFKASNFVDAIAVIKPEAVFGKEHDYAFVEENRDRLAKELGIDELEHHEQLDVIMRAKDGRNITKLSSLSAGDISDHKEDVMAARTAKEK